VVVSETTCDCGFHVCDFCSHRHDPVLPEGWAPGIGGYHHISGAEVQRRGERWAWYRRGVDTCPCYLHLDTAIEAMAMAVPVTWKRVEHDHGQVTYKHKLSGAIVWHFEDEPGVWRWGYDPEHDAVFCADVDAKPTLEEAQAAALGEVLKTGPWP